MKVLTKHSYEIDKAAKMKENIRKGVIYRSNSTLLILIRDDSGKYRCGFGLQTGNCVHC